MLTKEDKKYILEKIKEINATHTRSWVDSSCGRVYIPSKNCLIISQQFGGSDGYSHLIYYNEEIYYKQFKGYINKKIPTTWSREVTFLKNLTSKELLILEHFYNKICKYLSTFSYREQSFIYYAVKSYFIWKISEKDDALTMLQVASKCVNKNTFEILSDGVSDPIDLIYTIYKFGSQINGFSKDILIQLNELFKNPELSVLNGHRFGKQGDNNILSSVSNIKSFIKGYKLCTEEYQDYLRMIRNPLLQNKYKEIPDTNDIHKSHDQVARELTELQLLQEKERFDRINENYNKYYQIIKQYEYSNEKYSIIVPQDLSELVIEGKTLNHCVGSYVDSVACGKEYILFLRKNKDLKSPFLTVNLTTDLKCRQIHGNHNCNITDLSDSEEIINFLTEWCDSYKKLDKQSIINK